MSLELNNIVVMGGINNFTTAGTTTAYTGTLEGITSYVDQMPIIIKMHATNTGVATINVNGFGAIQLNNNDGVGILGGYLQIGRTYAFIYDIATTSFRSIYQITNTQSVNLLNVIRATTGVLNNTPVYNNGTGGVGATLTRTGNGNLNNIDGGALLLGELVLVKDQVSQIENGVYQYTQVGSGALPYILTRVSTYDATSEIYPSLIVVQTGGTNAGTFRQQVTINPVVGTNNIIFAQTSGAITLPVKQVAFGSASNTITSEAGFEYDNVTNSLLAGQMSTQVQNLTGAGATLTIDWALGSIAVINASGGTGTLTLTFTNAVIGTDYLIEYLDNATPRQIIFPATTIFTNAGGNSYTGTLPSARNTLGIYCTALNTYRGTIVAENLA